MYSKKLRNLGLSVLTAFGLFSSGFLSSCNQNTPNAGPGDNTPTYTCSSVSSEDYSDLNLSVDLTKYDESEGCFTVEEENFFNSLEYLKQNNLSTTQELEEIVKSFPTIGEATANSIWNSIMGYLNDKVEEPNLGNFNYKLIGVFPIIDAKNVNEITFRGKTHKLPFILENYGAPSRYADPNINPNMIVAVPYTPYPEALPFSFPDWKNKTDGETLDTLNFLGCIVCSASEDAFVTSYDFNLYRVYIFKDGTIVYEVKTRKELVVAPGKTEVVYIALDDSFSNRNDNGIVPHNQFSILLKYKVDKRDYPLFGGEVKEIYYSYVHVVPNIQNTFATVSDFPYKPGDILLPGDIVGYASPWMGPYYGADYNALVKKDSLLATKFNLPDYLKLGQYLDASILDMYLGVYYQKEIMTPSSNYPRGFLFLKPTNPRLYLRYDNTTGQLVISPLVYRPEMKDPNTGEWLNLP